MDSISDSDSEDAGSIPAGTTTKNAAEIQAAWAEIYSTPRQADNHLMNLVGPR